MKSISTAIFFVCFTIVSLMAPARAHDFDMVYRNAKFMGVGNTKVAGGFTYNGFTYNPALLTRVKRAKFCIIRIPLSVNSYIYDFGKFINNNTYNFLNYSTLNEYERGVFIRNIMKREGKWGRIFMSPMCDIVFSYRQHSIGLAGYATNEAGIKMDRGIYEPRVFGEGISNIAVVLGYARPFNVLNRNIKVGVNLKFLQRRRTKVFQIRARDLGNIIETIEPIYQEYMNKVSTYYAFDLGALWDIARINAAMGITLQSIGMGSVSSLDVGFVKQMYKNRLVLLADYNDFFDNNKENIFNKVHLGAEYRYAVFAVRGGINSGYPTYGVGLNLKIVDIDFAYYTEELGKAPGEKEERRLIVQIKLGW